MHQIITSDDKATWDSVIGKSTKKDIYYFQAYSSLYKESENGEPHLFVYSNGKESNLCYPFMKRNLNSLPFLGHSTLAGDYYDIVSPYGYGGPLYDFADKQIISAFRHEFDDYCSNENIISEFTRFHPLLDNHKYFTDQMEVKKISQTIYLDLSKSEEEIFGDFHTNHKRNIKKGIKNNLEFRILKEEDAIFYLDDFLKLYYETMDKLNASSYYYFSREYIKNLLVGLNQNSFIGAVFLKGKMITAALCMYCDKFIHYHLGCSKSEFLHLGANVFQFYHIALWGKKNGFLAFHLGGGYSGNDSLFKFKSRFNPEGILDFYIGKKVHNPVLYKNLIDSWESYYSQSLDSNYFPAYRSEPSKEKIIG